MISNKMKEQLAGEVTIRKMFEKGIEMKREFGEENVYDFSLGNPNVPAPDSVRYETVRIMETMDPRRIHSYMPNAGFTEVRVEVAKHLNRTFGTSYSDKNIVMTAGAGSALNLLFKATLDIGDEVVVPCPYFAEYKGYIENYYGKVVEVPPKQDGSFLPDPEAIGAAVTPRTKCVIIDTPNNPTGVVYPESSIKAIADVLSAREKEIGHPIYLISDEPYREICYDPAAAWDLGGSGATADAAADQNADAAHGLPWIPFYYKNAIVAYSYSKALSLPGERIGNIIIPSEVDGFGELVNAVTTANLITGVVNAPSLMQRVIARVIDEKVDLDYYRRNGELLYDIVTSAGFKALRPQGAFYLWMEAPGEDPDDKAFCDAAQDEHILMVPGTAFAGPGYVRLSYCVAREMIERSRDAFVRLAGRYGL